MREDVLASLMQLFAILGKLEQAPGSHREVVSHFLHEQLSAEDPHRWLSIYDEYLATILGRAGANAYGAHLSVKDSSRLLRICMQINGELGQRQKAQVLFILFSFLASQAVLLAEEREFLASVADIFNITQAEFASIEAFATGQAMPQAHAQDVLTIGRTLELAAAGNQRWMDAPELDGQLAVLRMPAIGMYLVRYQGRAPMYLNGVAMRPQVIYCLENGASLRSNTPDEPPIYYSDIVSKFSEESRAHSLTFEAREVTFKFPNGRQGLHTLSFAEEAGHMIGLMGPSGAGKSTLLEVLNGNLRPSSGQVLINGKDLYAHKGLFKGVIGYVPQDDLLIEELTVEQNLFYAAKLSLGSQTDEQLHAVVARTLESLGLSHIGGLRVGSPMQKTISGGERKRVNIGLELLRAPQVLFVDEPTSGLSSRDSLNVMELLKSLAEEGKLVFVVIHQPSSDIYKMFDRLCILDTGGYPIYYGNPVEAIRYFKSRAGIINKDQALCHECGNVNPEQVFDIVETRVVDEYGRFLNKRRYSPQHWYEQYQQFIHPPKLKTTVGRYLAAYKKAPIWRQLVTFIQRDVLAKLHNQQYLAINLLEAPLLAILLAYVFKYYKVDELNPTGYVYQENENIVVYFFISVIVALFLGLTVSAEEIFKDRRILKRESFLHLSRHAYYTSKVLILFTLSALQTALFVWIGNHILEVESLGWQSWLVLFSTSCFANLLGLNISSAFNSAVTIYILIPILLIPQLVMGGLVIKFDQINPGLRDGDAVPLWGEVMASRWAFEALAVTQFKDNPHQAPLYPYDRVLAQADYKRQYLLPVLEGKVEYCDLHLNTRDRAEMARIDRELRILCQTLSQEAGRHPRLRLEPPCGLSFGNYTLAEGQKLHTVIGALKDRYADIYNQAARRRDAYVQSQMATPAAAEAYVARARRLTNNGLAELVKNTRSTERIAQEGDRLVQKISPIYHVPGQPAHWYNFRTHFFAPQKYLAGHWWDTLYFNLGILWLMTAALYGMLYHGTLARFIRALEGLRRRP